MSGHLQRILTLAAQEYARNHTERRLDDELEAVVDDWAERRSAPELISALHRQIVKLEFGDGD